MMHARPASLNQALQHLEQQEFKILAGGTDYYPSLGDSPPQAATLDITNITALRGLHIEPDGVTIGALCSWTDIARAELPPALKALQLAATEVGSVQIQNRATVAGNLCNASPAADGVPPLLCLDAEVNLASVRGVRSVPLKQFIEGNRRTQKAQDELVTSIYLPAAACSGHSDFIKLGARKYLVISIAMVATRLVIKNGVVAQAALAVGSCSEVARRLPSIEQALIGQTANATTLVSILPSSIEGLAPIDDIRSSAGYRRSAALTLLQRSLIRCLANSEVTA